MVDRKSRRDYNSDIARYSTAEWRNRGLVFCCKMLRYDIMGVDAGIV